MRILGVNAVFHDPAAALLVDGRIVAAAEEERFSRRKHGKLAVPFSTWEIPERSARWCLAEGGIDAAELDAVAYSYDPDLAPQPNGDITADAWEGLRTLYARRAPLFLKTAVPGLDPKRVRFVAHHVAHAASAFFPSGFERATVMVLDGRGEQTSYLGGRYGEDGRLEILATQRLPHSLGLLYTDLTVHLGFAATSDEYKVMGLAAYGEPEFLPAFRETIRAREDGGFDVTPVDFGRFARPIPLGKEGWGPEHAALAASVQARLEEVLLVLAGGVALNCVANTRLWRESPFERIWVQPAAGDAGTALGAALHLASKLGDRPQPMRSAALGRGFQEGELATWLSRASLPFERPDDIAEAVAGLLAEDAVVAWFQGRAEYGPRALGHRSLLANAGLAENLERLNEIKGRE